MDETHEPSSKRHCSSSSQRIAKQLSATLPATKYDGSKSKCQDTNITNIEMSGDSDESDFEEEDFLVQNEKIQSAGAPGVQYRHTMKLNDRSLSQFAKWGTIVRGSRVNQDWVSVERKFLPLHVGGEPVLIPTPLQNKSEEAIGSSCRASTLPSPCRAFSGNTSCSVDGSQFDIATAEFDEGKCAHQLDSSRTEDKQVLSISACLDRIASYSQSSSSTSPAIPQTVDSQQAQGNSKMDTFATNSKTYDALLRNSVPASNNSSVSEKLHQLIGTWCDDRGDHYMLVRDGDDSLAVTTIRRNTGGSHKTTPALIRIDRRMQPSCIIFGEYGKPYRLSELSDKSLHWTRGHSKFQWHRIELSQFAVTRGRMLVLPSSQCRPRFAQFASLPPQLQDKATNAKPESHVGPVRPPLGVQVVHKQLASYVGKDTGLSHGADTHAVCRVESDTTIPPKRENHSQNDPSAMEPMKSDPVAKHFDHSEKNSPCVAPIVSAVSTTSTREQLLRRRVRPCKVAVTNAKAESNSQLLKQPGTAEDDSLSSTVAPPLCPELVSTSLDSGLNHLASEDMTREAGSKCQLLRQPGMAEETKISSTAAPAQCSVLASKPSDSGLTHATSEEKNVHMTDAKAESIFQQSKQPCTAEENLLSSTDAPPAKPADLELNHAISEARDGHTTNTKAESILQPLKQPSMAKEDSLSSSVALPQFSKLTSKPLDPGPNHATSQDREKQSSESSCDQAFLDYCRLHDAPDAFLEEATSAAKSQSVNGGLHSESQDFPTVLSRDVLGDLGNVSANELWSESAPMACEEINSLEEAWSDDWEAGEGDYCVNYSTDAAWLDSAHMAMDVVSYTEEMHWQATSENLVTEQNNERRIDSMDSAWVESGQMAWEKYNRMEEQYQQDTEDNWNVDQNDEINSHFVQSKLDEDSQSSDHHPCFTEASVEAVELVKHEGISSNIQHPRDQSRSSLQKPIATLKTRYTYGNRSEAKVAQPTPSKAMPEAKVAQPTPSKAMPEVKAAKPTPSKSMPKMKKLDPPTPSYPQPCMKLPPLPSCPAPACSLTLQVITFGVRFQSVDSIDCDLAVDARCFRDPAAGALRAHDGHHPEIMSRMLQHERFPQWFRDLRRDIERLSRNAPGSTLTVGLFCRSGRHRCVAASLMLEHVAKELDYHIHDTQHTILEPCECNECQWRSPIALARVRGVLAQALEIWKSDR